MEVAEKLSKTRKSIHYHWKPAIFCKITPDFFISRSTIIENLPFLNQSGQLLFDSLVCLPDLTTLDTFSLPVYSVWLNREV